MIHFYTLPPAFGLRNVSPFCLKIEMMLEMLELPYELHLLADPRKAPKGKLPYMTVDGETIADSELILKKLDEMTGGKVYGGLSAEDIAIGTAFTRLAEEHLYWLMVASRWLEPAWFGHVAKGFFNDFPAPLRGLIANLARRQVRQTYHLQGLGRHSFEDQQYFARRDLAAINDRVAANGYITAGSLTVFDYAVAGILVGLMDNQPPTWISKIAAEYPALRTYTDKVQQETNVFALESASA